MKKFILTVLIIGVLILSGCNLARKEAPEIQPEQNKNQTCVDSDNGRSHYIKGEAIYCDFVTEEEAGAKTPVGCASHPDFCPDKNYLWEYYCEENILKFEKYECQNGCREGACFN